MHAPYGSAPGDQPVDSRTVAAPGRPANGRAATATEPRADGRFALPRLTLRRSGEAARARTPDASATSAAADAVPDAVPDDGSDSGAGNGSEADWRALGLFGAGLVLGALIGAGTALLTAPASGFETRARLARRTRMAGEDVAERWDDLNDRVRRSARRSRRRLAQLTLSRWRAQDAWERKRCGQS